MRPDRPDHHCQQHTTGGDRGAGSQGPGGRDGFRQTNLHPHFRGFQIHPSMFGRIMGDRVRACFVSVDTNAESHVSQQITILLASASEISV